MAWRLPGPGASSFREGQGSIETAFRSAFSSLGGQIVTSVDDRGTGTWQRSRQVPIESSVIDPRKGAISRIYDHRSAGLNVSMELRESSCRSARVNFNVQLGDVISGGDGSGPPVIADQSLKVSADVYTGGVYLVGALREGSGNQGAAGALKFGDRRSSDSTEVVVFARVARIGGSLLPDPATEGAELEGRVTSRGSGVTRPAICPDPVPNPVKFVPAPAGPELPRLAPLGPLSHAVRSSEL